MLLVGILVVGFILSVLTTMMLAKKGNFMNPVEKTYRGDLKPSTISIGSVFGSLIGLWFVFSVITLLFSLYTAVCLTLTIIILLMVGIVLLVAIKFSPENDISRAWDKFVEEEQAKKINPNLKAEKVVDITP